MYVTKDSGLLGCYTKPCGKYLPTPSVPSSLTTWLWRWRQYSSFEKSVTIHHSTWHKIWDNLNLQ